MRVCCLCAELRVRFTHRTDIHSLQYEKYILLYNYRYVADGNGRPTDLIGRTETNLTRS